MSVMYEGIASDTNGLVYIINSGRKGDLWVKDKEGKDRQIRYAENQKSIYIDEQKGHSKLPTLMLKDGVMTAERDTLVDFMDAHPLLNIKFRRIDPERDAAEALEHEEQVTLIKAEILKKGKKKDGDVALQSLLVMKSKVVSHLDVQSMGPNQVRQALYGLANAEPEIFLDEDGNFNAFQTQEFIYQDVVLRAMAAEVIIMSPGGTKVSWANGETIIRVPKGKNEVEFFASWLRSEEGNPTLKQIAEEMDEE